MLHTWAFPAILLLMKLDFLIAGIFAFVFAFVFLKFALKFFPKLGLIDRPADYGLQRSPIPYSAGLVFFFICVFAALFFVDINRQILGVLAAGGLITAVSFLDDRLRLNPVFRLAVQFLAAAVVIFAGVKIQLFNNPFGGSPIYLDAIQFDFFGQTIWLFSALAIAVWLILMMNVMNWLDGIPGLASGVSVIAQVSVFILSIQKFNTTDQSTVIIFSAALAAASAAFLIFDFYPPKLLMGDSGSMFLGFMLGVLSILAGGKLATALLIMGFPVIDAFAVILKRILRRQSPLKGDFSHFHHNLLRVGLSERKALIVNYILCASFASIALFLHSTFAKAIAFAGVFLCVVAAQVMISVKLKR